jgi:uncharacterized linocin/CFP29 family protein
MNDLLRALAPIAEPAWHEIDREIKATLQQMLAARRLVDFRGPLGWEAAAVGTGRVRTLSDTPNAGVEARTRLVRPLVELRAPFELARAELDAVTRGAQDPDLEAAVNAARAIAIAEDRAIFHGYDAGGIDGICEAAADAALTITAEYELYPAAVAKALNLLMNAGVGGPYAIALGPRCYTGLTQTTVGGYPVFTHVQRLVDGPAVWAPGLDGAAVLSMRGGDFELAVGRDLSVGYLSHTETTVRLYVEESFTFQVLTPEAAVPLVYESSPRAKVKGARRA